MRYDVEGTPWDRRAERGQEAATYERAAVGGESPWYVGARYVASAPAAAVLRQQEATKGAAAHLRAIAFVARETRGRPLPSSARALKALVLQRGRAVAGHALTFAQRARLARAAAAVWAAVASLSSSAAPASPAAA